MCALPSNGRRARERLKAVAFEGKLAAEQRAHASLYIERVWRIGQRERQVLDQNYWVRLEFINESGVAGAVVWRLAGPSCG